MRNPRAFRKSFATKFVILPHDRTDNKDGARVSFGEGKSQPSPSLTFPGTKWLDPCYSLSAGLIIHCSMFPLPP